MKTAFLPVLFIALILFATSSSAQDIDTTLVEFVQGDKVYSIHSSSSAITLEKKPFSIRFWNRRYDEANEKYYAARIAILKKADNGIEVGMENEEIPFFNEGTGFAMSADDDFALFITEDGHHYLYYASEEDRTTYLLSDHSNWLKLEWRIKGYFADDADSEIEKISYNKLYFVFLFDRNLNSKIDEGELKKVVVSFK